VAMLVSAAALVVYLHPWEATRPLPACDDQQIRREMQTILLVTASNADVVSEANTVDFDNFRQIDVVQVNGIVYERACATTMRLDQDRREMRFQILKAAGAAGYRLSVLDA
jgi:hypothetical protein